MTRRLMRYEFGITATDFFGLDPISFTWISIVYLMNLRNLSLLLREDVLGVLFVAGYVEATAVEPMRSWDIQSFDDDHDSRIRRC